VDSEHREQLGRLWLETALGEHASVAAFARFVLHLLSLGAPPELLLDAIQAMKDEVHHARFSFGIARQFTNQAAGPGRMNISGVLDDGDDPSSILRAAILEGCFEETISAECARVAGERVEVPAIGAALVQIADDEAKHADLAWRFVDWILKAYPELKPIAEDCFAWALANHSAIEEEESVPSQENYGLLLPSSRRQVREATLRETIVPRIKTIFGYVPTTSLPEPIS